MEEYEEEMNAKESKMGNTILSIALLHSRQKEENNRLCNKILQHKATVSYNNSCTAMYAFHFRYVNNDESIKKSLRYAERSTIKSCRDAERSMKTS